MVTISPKNIGKLFIFSIVQDVVCVDSISEISKWRHQSLTQLFCLNYQFLFTCLSISANSSSKHMIDVLFIIMLDS